MTENGRRVLEVMADLEEKDSKTENQWFEASRITKHFIERFGDLGRAKPVMTISGFLTHLKRIGLVERQVTTDKMFAYWRRTPKGKDAL